MFGIRTQHSARPRNVIVPSAWRRHPVLAAAALFLALSAAADHLLMGHQEDDYRRYHARAFRVYAVIDGVTFEIDRADRDSDVTRVRLCGLTLPEPDPDEDPPGLAIAEATALARQLLLGQDVNLELAPSCSRDADRRLLAYAYLTSTGQQVNELLLVSGSVRIDSELQHPYAQRFKALQGRAQR
jgi:endonuclease YncB( thermonuclease family)